jgi:hypothetical protein
VAKIVSIDIDRNVLCPDEWTNVKATTQPPGALVHWFIDGRDVGFFDIITVGRFGEPIASGQTSVIEGRTSENSLSATVTRKVAEIEIELDPPPVNQIYVITAEPRMPSIFAKAAGVGGPISGLQWTVSINNFTIFDPPCAPPAPTNLSANFAFSPTHGGQQITLDFNNLIRGGQLSIAVRGTVNGCEVAGGTGAAIHGTNPQRSDIQAALPHDTLRRIACKESLQRQFNAPPDGGIDRCPLFGRDGRVGIMQIANPTHDEVWNWRINVGKGIELFNEIVDAARRYPNQVKDSAGFEDLVNHFNQKRQQTGLSPIQEIVLPDFTTGNFDNDLQQLELDAIRGYNGWRDSDRFGFELHEFRVAVDRIDGEDVLRVININEQTLTGEAVWEQVPVADRAQNLGEPDYVSQVLGFLPTCLDIPLPATPTITATNSVVVVRKPYTSPARRRVELGVSAGFIGTSTLTISKPSRIRFFDAVTAGNPVASGAVFTAAELQAGVVIFAEGVKASDKVNDVGLTLSLSSGLEASISVTAVELFLDIHASRKTSTTLPAALSTARKLNPGRFVHVQDAGFHHGRAMLTVQPTKPRDFAGTLVLEAPGANPRVRLFAAAHEVAAAGQASLGTNVHAIPATGGRFWVEGAQVSGALRDSDLRLGIDGLEPDGDRVALTVVQFSNLQATVPGSPPHTARLANGPVATHLFTVGANGFDEDPRLNPPLLLVENSIVEADPIALQVTVLPTGTPVSWGAQRASGIAAASGGDDSPAIVALHTARAPTVGVRPGNDRQATLLANNSGTFHVRSFVDCNGNRKFDHRIDREPNIVLNLVLGRVTLRQDNAGGGIQVRAVMPGAIPFDISTPAAQAMHLNAQVDVVTGGADGRRGIDRFFGGWINNLAGSTSFSPTYTDATVVPPTVHPAPFVFASNGNVATGAGIPSLPGNPRSFQAGDAAPAIVAPPILDTGRPLAGTGGDSAALATSRIRSRTNLAPGERWIVEAVDSPGNFVPGTHLNRGMARLTSYEMTMRFAATLAVWTNNATPPVSSPTGDPADRLYAVLLRVSWNINGRWTITPATGAITVATAPTTVKAATATTSPAVAARRKPVEVRPPAVFGVINQDARA